MIRVTVESDPSETCYHGLRMSAEEYFSLPETETRYELIDGVVLISPSSTPLHQQLVACMSHWIASHLDLHPTGNVYVQIDVNLGAGLQRDLVYRPDVVYLRRERADQSRSRIDGPPDLLVEVVSPDSREYDMVTKKHDYERCGVLEYWVIDPYAGAATLYAREGDQFVEVAPTAAKLASRVLPGFTVPLDRIRKFLQSY